MAARSVLERLEALRERPPLLPVHEYRPQPWTDRHDPSAFLAHAPLYRKAPPQAGKDHEQEIKTLKSALAEEKMLHAAAREENANLREQLALKEQALAELATQARLDREEAESTHKRMRRQQQKDEVQ